MMRSSSIVYMSSSACVRTSPPMVTPSSRTTRAADDDQVARRCARRSRSRTSALIATSVPVIRPADHHGAVQHADVPVISRRHPPSRARHAHGARAL
jgi:hypothetical protein